MIMTNHRTAGQIAPVAAGVALISAVAVIVALLLRRHSAVAQAVADRRRDGHARSTSLPSRESVIVVPLASTTRSLSFEISHQQKEY
jgi:hypothetical protein